MGAVWGVVSGKFVVAATGLLISSRVDHGRLQALVDTRAPKSAVSRDFAERRHLIASADALETQARRPMSIGIGALEFDQASLAVSQARFPDGADLMIGRDILGGHVLAIDMRQHVLSLLEKSDQARLPRHFEPVPISVDDQGILKVRILLNGRPEEVAFDLAQREPLFFSTNFWHPSPAASPASRADVRLGSVELSVPVVVTSRSSDAPVTLSLAAFDGRALVLDLPHGRLWVGTDRRR